MRAGMVLVEVGFANIRILARRPPRTLPHTQAVAAELWPMCDEFWPIDRPGWAFREIGSIAECILDIPIWSLWLDQPNRTGTISLGIGPPSPLAPLTRQLG